MKNQTEFLSSVYSRADAETRRLKKQKKRVITAVLALVIAVPVLFAVRKFVTPQANVEDSTGIFAVSESSTVAPVTGAPENYTGAPAMPTEASAPTGTPENDTGAPPTTLPPGDEIITDNPSEGYVVIDNSVLIEPDRYTAVCIPVNDRSSLSGDTVPARREAYLIRTPAELAAASRALRTAISAGEDCFEEHVMVAAYLVGYDAASFSDENLRVYTEGCELIAEVSHAQLADADALLLVTVDRGCVSYANSASAVLVSAP